MKVYFATGEILEGHRAAIRRAIKVIRRFDGPIPYWFSAKRCAENYKKYHTYD